MARETTISEDGTYPLDIHQGIPLDLELELDDDAGNPISLVGYSGASQVRDSPDGGALLLTITVTVSQAATGADKGKVWLSAPAGATGAMRRGGVWDLELTNGSGKPLLVIAQSPANIIRQVTT